MPSYRYLRDIDPEDNKPEPQRVYTKKEKAVNWWHYAWKWLALLMAALLIAGFFIWDVTSTVKPDISIGIVTPYSLPDELLHRLETELRPFASDLNEDGRVVVSVRVFTLVTQPDISGQDQDDELFTQMLGITHLNGAFSSGDPMLFLAEPVQAAAYQQEYRLFGYLDGSPADAGAPVDNLTMAWEDCPALTGLDLLIPNLAGNSLNGQQIFAGYRIGVRGIDIDSRAGNDSWKIRQNDALSLLSALHEAPPNAAPALPSVR